RSQCGPRAPGTRTSPAVCTGTAPRSLRTGSLLPGGRACICSWPSSFCARPVRVSNQCIFFDRLVLGASSEFERHPRRHRGRIVAPDAWVGVDIEFEPVPVGIVEVDGLTDGVVPQAQL